MNTELRGGNVMKLIQLSKSFLYSKTALVMSIFSSQYKRTQKYLIGLIVLFVFSCFSNSAIAIEPQQLELVKKVVNAVKNNNRTNLSKLVSYPLLRQAPLAPINNPKEFLERYDEVFDRYLISTISASNLLTDWDSIGWRGVILDNGIVALDPEGNITEINHHSQHEQSLVNQLTAGKVAKGRRALHRSDTNYSQALVELTTKRFQIRVDSLDGGVLRYTSWPVGRLMTDKPELILSNGQIIGGNGRNQRFVFDNGSFSYQLNIKHSVGNMRVSGSLQVFKSGKPWINEVATKVLYR